MARTEDGDGDTGEHGEIERRDEQRTTASGRLLRRSGVMATVVSGSMAERETPVSFFFFSLVPLLLCFQVNFFSSDLCHSLVLVPLFFFAAYFLSHLHLSISLFSFLFRFNRERTRAQLGSRGAGSVKQCRRCGCPISEAIWAR